MEILIEDMQNRMIVTEEMNELLKKAIELSLRQEGFDTPSEISVLLVDDERIQEINREQRNLDKPTDVLSFPVVEMENGKMLSNEGDYDLDENLLLLGDIVISMDTAKQQSEEYGHSLNRELAFLVTHGVFHLLGYDHMEEAEEKRMIGKQEAVLEAMGLTR